jgi:uncharacterized protein (UPF0332 family)
MTQGNRQHAAAAERDAAQRAFGESLDLQRLGHHGGAVSRAYYAAYHAARALLYNKGVEPKTHEGLRRMIGVHYVLTGELAATHADALARLAFMRDAADYAPARPATASDAAEAVDLARAFLAAAGVTAPPR